MIVSLGLTLGLTICLLSFQLALDSHFIRAGKMPRGAILLAVLSAGVYLGAVVRLWLVGPPTPILAISAAILMILSLSLFHYTRKNSPSRALPVAFEALEPPKVLVEGPYKAVRHPFYVAYMLYWSATVLSAPDFFIAAGALAIGGLYVSLALREEKKILASPLGPEYREYQLRSGRFFPRVRRR